MQQKNTTNSILNSSLNIEGKSGYKYYVQSKAKSDKLVYFDYYLRTRTTVVSTFSSQITLTDEYIKHTGLITLNENVTNTGLHIRTISNKNTDATITMKEVSMLNLTQTFGAGNEPTKQEMDKLMEILGVEYFEEITPTKLDIINWQLGLIRQNTQAIIALGGTIL